MDLLAQAGPFFILAVIIELIIDKLRGSGFYRANDAINSISTGILYITSGYFTKFISLVAWGFALQNFALIDMPLSWFVASPKGIALWIAAALAWDFCYYWFHRMSHEVSILWASHAVHHQSEDYNLSTAQRQSSTGFLLGWIFYVPLYVVGFPLEVVLTVGAINLIYQFWVHTQLIGRMGVLDRILVTPSNHRVHHAQNERYIDKNYGGILILWDRLFGTFEDERNDDPVIFGVRKPLANWNPIWANFQVYDYLIFDAVRTKRWRDKIGIWFRRTGWRPGDMQASHPKAHSDLARFQKFDPEIGAGMRRYVMFQFVVAILITLEITQVLFGKGIRVALLPCLMLWALLYTLGLLSGGRTNAVTLEVLRLVVFNWLVSFALQYNGIGVSKEGWLLAALYTAASLLWLWHIKNSVKTIIYES
jgi:sterol desaturase/sphingolipid hydroxylase (fatty acid hydroxylase superfamily)